VYICHLLFIEEQFDSFALETLPVILNYTVIKLKGV